MALSISACKTVSMREQQKVEPDLQVELKVNSLDIMRIEEKGVLGIQDGDELTLVYSINGYDQNGNLISVNNGFWGTRTHEEGTTVPADEFDRIKVSIPRQGKVIAAFTMIEVDDYRGERRIIAVKKHTKSERFPKASRSTKFEEDQNLEPTDLIARSFKIAGYRNLIARHLQISSNDYLGSTKQVLDWTDVNQILNKNDSGRETYKMDGTPVNEDYLYELKYDFNVTRIPD
jgi:hypothetical protein